MRAPFRFFAPLGALRGLIALSILFVLGVANAAAAVVNVPVQLGERNLLVKAVLPPGTRSVSLQVLRGKGVWTTIEERAVNPGPYSCRLSLPSVSGLVRLRADVETPSRKKFPAKFYRGRNSFAPSRSLALQEFDRLNTIAVPLYSASVGVDVGTDSGAQPATEEADIWKISGRTVYFFNQLRGLQVIDFTDPSAPLQTANLRLPAAGQDLYLLPSGAGYQDVLLITSETDPDGGPAATMLRVVRVANGATQVLQSAKTAGSAVGSRLKGSRLYLCTQDWNAPQGELTSLTEWAISADASPALLDRADLAGDFGALAAGEDWLAVAYSAPGSWMSSSVAAYRLGLDKLEALSAAPVATSGRVDDQFQIQWRAGVLSTASKNWGSVGGLSVVLASGTKVENFRADGPSADGALLGSVALGAGETLQAARFDGDKAYLVTFQQIDPLFVVDLSDPAAPVVAGEVQVPGWSTHIEPLGDRLFTVGWENGAVVASLFNVSDPSAPALEQRLNLTDGYGYSESNWDPRALRLLPDAGLALVPITTYDQTGETHGVRLVDVDAANGKIAERGLIAGRFPARRADVVGDVVVALSQRTLTAADVSDRDQPKILADELVAWPVNLVVPAGDKVFAIESGGAWSESTPTLRVSPKGEPDTVLAELDLGAGYVRDAALRDGRLYVLRETGGSIFPLPYVRYGGWFSPLGTLSLDIYDASDPLALRLLGSCACASDGGVTRSGRLLWPRANRPAVLLDAGDFFYDGLPIVYRPIAMPLMAASVAKATPAVLPEAKLSVMPNYPYWRRGAAPSLLVYDVGNPAAPTSTVVKLGDDGDRLAPVAEADAGLLVTGLDRWSFRQVNRKGNFADLGHLLLVVDVPETGAPFVRKPIDVAGSLCALGVVARDGFLAYTRDDAGVQVNACDGWDAFEVARRAGAIDAAAADDRVLFVLPSGTGKPLRLRLTDEGRLVEETMPAPSWYVSDLQVRDHQLLGSAWRRLFVAPVDGKTPSVDWNFAAGFTLDELARAADGDWILPMDDYGFETRPTVPPDAPSP